MPNNNDKYIKEFIGELNGGRADANKLKKWLTSTLNSVREETREEDIEIVEKLIISDGYSQSPATVHDRKMIIEKLKSLESFFSD